MVARINFPRHLEAALRYNELKVRRGVADCLAAAGYLGEVHTLDYRQKLAVLQRRNELNGRALTRTVHLSLNFHPREHFSEERLCAIARAYMERIGFGEQPYLVYRHRDAAHPHLHVVSTLIRTDGRRIPTHHLGRGASEKARRAVEQLFGLVAAEGKRPRGQVPLPAEKPSPLVYGHHATRESIAAIVHYVGAHSPVASLADLNAALRPYNVLADPGAEGSLTRKGGGLVYHVLGPQGEKVGVPLKASALPGRPTLAWLRERFPKNSDPRSAPGTSRSDAGLCGQAVLPETEPLPATGQSATYPLAASLRHPLANRGRALPVPVLPPGLPPSCPEEEYVAAALWKKKKRKGKKPSPSH